MDVNSHKLVSCTVLTYNSSATVTETLDSIFNQTYKYIELIVSDDCSKDNTVEVCRDWMKLHRDRFVRCELLTVEQNTGVAENANRALYACNGDWQKCIAGDDIMFPNCLSDLVEFIGQEPEARWISSYVSEYHNTFAEENCRGHNMVYSRSFFNHPVEKQLWIMVRRNLIYAPSVFFHNPTLKKLGGFDKKYRVEDFPLYMLLLENGYKCYFMEKETVGYRIHESLAHSDTHLFHYTNQLEVRRFRKDLCFKYLSTKERLGLRLLWKMQDFLQKMGMNNRKNRFASSVYRLVSYLTHHVFIPDVRNV